MPTDVSALVERNNAKIEALQAKRDELVRRNRQLRMAAANKAAAKDRKARARMLIQLGILVTRCFERETWAALRDNLTEQIAAAQAAAERYAAEGRGKEHKKASKATRDYQTAADALDILISGGTID